MKLPGADKAIVSREKIVDYLFNAAHPDNGGKAEFFVQLGFRCDQWEILAPALNDLASTGEVAGILESPVKLNRAARPKHGVNSA